MRTVPRVNPECAEGFTGQERQAKLVASNTVRCANCGRAMKFLAIALDLHHRDGAGHRFENVEFVASQNRGGLCCVCVARAFCRMAILLHGHVERNREAL